MVQGPLVSSHTYTHTRTLVHQLLWCDLSCFMSASGTLSLNITLLLCVSWIEQVCLHTATSLMRLFTLGFFFFLCMCFDALLMLWMKDGRCVCVFLCVRLTERWNEMDLFKNVCQRILCESEPIRQQWLREVLITGQSALLTHSVNWNVQTKQLTASH